MALLKDATLFCTNSSLRGVGKIVKSPTRLLRSLWGIYVIIMVSALFTCVFFIIRDYLEYKTVIQTEINPNDPSNTFPAFTFCNHNPFSEEAVEHWKKNEVMSPTNFSRKLRSISYDLLQAKELQLTEFVTSNDMSRVYYQSLSLEDSTKISHSPPNFFIFCISNMGRTFDLGAAGQCNAKIKLISMPDYFNCYQVQASSNSQDKITLILHVSAKSDPYYQEAFVGDLFEQAYGIRLMIHENNTLPDLNAEGLHIEPGKMFELSYIPYRWQESGTPKESCLDDEAVSSMVIKDLNQTYQYTPESCVKQEMGRMVVRACGCYHADYLRENIPNDTHPYCGDFSKGLDAVLKRLQCLSKINFTDADLHIREKVCSHKCNYFTYQTFTSQTRWRPTDWQLSWLMGQSQALKGLYPIVEGESSENYKDSRHYKYLEDYFTRKNISQAKSNLSLTHKDSDYCYLSIRRQNRMMFQQIEELSLGLSALFSRLGGLCSLFLGLTCAFVVELLEFCLLKREQCRKESHIPSEAVPLSKLESADGGTKSEIKS